VARCPSQRVSAPEGVCHLMGLVLGSTATQMSCRGARSPRLGKSSQEHDLNLVLALASAGVRGAQ